MYLFQVSFLILFDFFNAYVIFLATNTLPIELLLDYSCIDNLEKSFLPNSYHRNCLNYAQVAAYIYETQPSDFIRTAKIGYAVKNMRPDSSDLNINNFQTLLRHSSVAPHLVRLLRARGVWTLNCEQAYERLVKCRVEHVCHYHSVNPCLPDL
jgi:hypothetical protein